MLSPIFSRSSMYFPVVLLSLASCSDNQDRGEPSDRASAREFSAQDKKAAQVLSLANNDALENVSSPYARALLCRAAIEDVTARLTETGTLNDEQTSGVEAAKAVFDQRLRSLADGQGKSTSEIRRDLAQASLNNPGTDSDNARIAMACLQQLQRAG